MRNPNIVFKEILNPSNGILVAFTEKSRSQRPRDIILHQKSETKIKKYGKVQHITEKCPRKPRGAGRGKDDDGEPFMVYRPKHPHLSFDLQDHSASIHKIKYKNNLINHNYSI